MYERTELLIGKENVDKLKDSGVIVFGIGGVGSFVCESLARAGVGRLTLVDYDTIASSNINRQIHALNSTIGKKKVDVMKARIYDINPDANVSAVHLFYLPEVSPDPLPWGYDYVVDAVDNITAKIHIIKTAKAKGISVISCMGTGNKLDPTKFEVADIFDTSVCPLAKIMRKELRRQGITSLKTVFSTEVPVRTQKPPASISFVPSVAGLIISGEIIKDLVTATK